MDITVPKFEQLHEGLEENEEENVSLVLEESEFASCEGDYDETNEEILDQYTPKVYSSNVVNLSEERVDEELLQIEGDESNREIEVMVPNSLHPYQVMHNPYDGKIYVITDNEESFATQTIRIKCPNPSGESVSKKRDDKRRVTHNEVERRRRDKINTWITTLGKLLPKYKTNGEEVGDSKHNFESQSKGGILSRACDYIKELKETNKTLDRRVVENKHMLQEVKQLRQTVAQLRKENSLLKYRIEKIGT